MLLRMWSNKNFTAGGNAKWYSYSGRQSGSFSHTTHTFTVWSNNHSPWYLPKEAEKLCPHTNLHMGANRSFIHYCPNLETTDMSFSRWVDKLWYTQTRTYYAAMKRNKPQWDLKCILLRKSSQSEKATCCWSQLCDHLEKAKLWRK